MRKTAVVGQDKLLALDVDVIDIVSVDDEAPADTDEQVAIAAKLLVNHSLNLPQLEGEHTRLVVSLHKVAVIAIRRDKDNLVRRNAHQVCGSGYDQILLEHSATKVTTSLECKDRLLVEMYEICRKMYEMLFPLRCRPHGQHNSLSNQGHVSKQIMALVFSVPGRSSHFTSL